MDAVICWVDGDDPVLSQKRAQYTGKGETVREDIAHPTRFRQVGEIEWCVASILKFAPFVEHIFIVTDGQKSPVEHPKIRVVDHREIFRGYEEYLPTFNSLSIETMLWRIEGLAEEFISFNDDMMLCTPSTPQDWFCDGRAVVRGRWGSVPWRRVAAMFKPKFGFKESMVNSARRLGEHWHYWELAHIPYVMLRSVMERYYGDHPDVMISNLRHRFRNPEQHNPQNLFAMLALAQGSGVECSTDGLLYIGRGADIEDKIKQTDNKRFACIQSLDMATEQQQRTVEAWLRGILKGKDD